MIKSHLINKFICLRGTVLRVSSIKVLVESITFQCHECKARIVMHFLDGKVRNLTEIYIVGDTQ